MAVKLRRQLSVPRINLFGGLLSLSTFFLVRAPGHPVC
jgi:hypothetical protein